MNSIISNFEESNDKIEEKLNEACLELREINRKNEALKEAISWKITEIIQYVQLKQQGSMEPYLNYSNRETGNGN